MSQIKMADSLAPTNAWDTMQKSDPFRQMLAEEAAPLVGIAYPLNLNTATLGDKDFVPYVKRGTGRTFLLGDVMTEAAARNGLPPPKFPNTVATTIEAARAVLKKRVGPTPPAWHDEKRHRSNADVAGVAATRKPVLPTIPQAQAVAIAAGGVWGASLQNIKVSNSKKSKAAHRPVMQVSGTFAIPGGRVIANIAKFASLGDFMQNALPDDEWLFAVPPKGTGRPYDFLESLLAGESDVPWKVMTYRDYLQAMLDASIDDYGTAIAEAEQLALTQEIAHGQG